jgi:hypothetical protein
MTDDVLGDEERRALGFFSPEERQIVQTWPVEKQKRCLAEVAAWSKGSPTVLDKELHEMRKRILDQFRD